MGSYKKFSSNLLSKILLEKLLSGENWAFSCPLTGRLIAPHFNEGKCKRYHKDATGVFYKWLGYTYILLNSATLDEKEVLIVEHSSGERVAYALSPDNIFVYL